MSEKNNNANQQANQKYSSNSNPYYNYQKNANAQAYYPQQQMQPNQQSSYQKYQQYQQYPQYQQYQQHPQYQQYQQYQFPNTYTYLPYQQAPQQQQPSMGQWMPVSPQQQQPGLGQGMPVSPQPMQNNANALPVERSYIENILRLNTGKRVSIHMTFEQGGKEGNVKVFTGILEAAGRDHIIISDPETDERYLLLMIYLDYVVFPEEINYQYPFGNTQSLSTYPPR